jgi:hypothetical protein
MTRQIKDVQQIRQAIIERVMPPSHSPEVQTIVTDMTIERLKVPDASGCNWKAKFTTGPKDLATAVTAVQALYNLPADPAASGPVVRSAMKGTTVQL